MNDPGFQYRQPKRQPDLEVRQLFHESHRHDDHVFPPCRHYRGKPVIHNIPQYSMDALIGMGSECLRQRVPQLRFE